MQINRQSPRGDFWLAVWGYVYLNCWHMLGFAVSQYWPNLLCLSSVSFKYIWCKCCMRQYSICKGAHPQYWLLNESCRNQKHILKFVAKPIGRLSQRKELHYGNKSMYWVQFLLAYSVGENIRFVKEDIAGVLYMLEICTYAGLIMRISRYQFPWIHFWCAHTLTSLFESNIYSYLKFHNF